MTGTVGIPTVTDMARSDTYSDEGSLAIGAVARRFGVSVDTIRAWEREGKLAPSRRTPGNQRRWNASEIDALLERTS